ncbi:MAG: TIGR03032 family protein [Bradyrhizobium sp.]|uniref:TIGR03032 family protein n=1 Tax=Bradyrhizobium sp. TaxID=376 RepID=UPI0029AC2791|nr:TIGR03032 family protein [Bradyrhizobium sp.]MDX3971980.1 TIGR03032 family protein [Bradyrhizobium sp.]
MLTPSRSITGNEVIERPADRLRTDAAAEQGGKRGGDAVKYSMSPGLPAFLGSERITLAVSSYQSGKFYLIGQNVDGGLLVHERFFHKAMGICVADRDTILLATLFQIVKFRNVLGREQTINDLHDACYVPRELFITGELDVHDIGLMKDGGIVFVNTLYNCLATTSERHSFTPLWKPSFISKIVKEDRCHLNGLAMEAGVPRYVTAVSRSDTVDGWRDRRANGGIVIDVPSGAVVLGGLSMPHSPRMYRGRLWLLNSGTGEIGWIERGALAEDGRFQVLAFCPGFVRGLAFHGKYAFVGLSKPRYERFEGLPLDRRLAEADSEPWCGVQIIDLDTGACVHWFRIDGSVTELYDLGVVPDAVRPMALGFTTDEILNLITHDPLETDGSA